MPTLDNAHSRHLLKQTPKQRHAQREQCSLLRLLETIHVVVGIAVTVCKATPTSMHGNATRQTLVLPFMYF